ncbi:MAG TPA: glutamate--tRNA ligase, partial [Parasegetibacter sp.]
PRTGEFTEGFRERGFLPEAFVNLLALLGWNDGTEQELFSLDELIGKFSIERIHRGGAKFDFEKAKWFNHEWIKRNSAEQLLPHVKSVLEEKDLSVDNDSLLKQVIDLVKERCSLLGDFYDQSSFFFRAPENIDADSVKPKWNDAKTAFFNEFVEKLNIQEDWSSENIEAGFKELTAAHAIKPGEVMLPFRIMLVGGKFGPAVFDIARMIGKEETIARIKKALSIFRS